MSRPTEKRKLDGTTDAEATETDGYFASYAGLGIHEEMLSCRRTDAYLDAIRAIAEQVRGKAVLDVGCGTGVLSIACARAGARVVYAVEASSIAECARSVVASNGLEETVIVMRGKMEEIELPEPVDVIVSEWMGCLLLYESMLDSVLAARDRWLRPGGTMLPRRARLWLAPYRDDESAAERRAFWADVHGVDMSCLVPVAEAELACKPQVEWALAQNVTGDASCVLDLDLSTCAISDVQGAEGPFRCRSHVRADVRAFVGHFDVELVEGSWLDTSPSQEPTHWRQVLFFLSAPLAMAQDEVVRGVARLGKNAVNSRCWDVELEYGTEDGSGAQVAPAVSRRWTLDVSC